MALSDDDFEKLGKLIENAIDRRISRFEQTTNASLVAIVQEMQAMEQRLNARIDRVEQKLNARIDAVEQRLDARIDAVEQKLGTRIDGVEQRLDARIKGVEQRLDARINGVEQRLQGQIDGLRALLLDVQKTLNEHGAFMEQIFDGLTGLYKREHLLEQRTERLETLYRQRFPPAPPTAP